MTRTWTLTLAVLTAAAAMLPAAPARAQGPTIRFSGDIVVPAGAVHEGAAIAMNGRIQVDGTLNGDAMTMNGDIAVSGTVRGSVRTFNGNITLAATAVVEGDVWTANGRVDRRPGAQVRGQVQAPGAPGPAPGAPPGPVPPATPGVPPAPSPMPPPEPPDRWGPWMWAWQGPLRAAATWTLVSFVLLAAVAALIFPSLVRRIADVLHVAPGESVLAGFILWIVLPPLALFLVLSLVGIPMAAFLPFLVMVLVLLGLAGASQLIGDRLLGGFGQRHHTALEAVVGAAILGLLAFIPGVGWLALLVAVTWGVGGVLMLIIRRIRGSPPPAPQPVPPPPGPGGPVIDPSRPVDPSGPGTPPRP